MCSRRSFNSWRFVAFAAVEVRSLLYFFSFRVISLVLPELNPQSWWDECVGRCFRSKVAANWPGKCGKRERMMVRGFHYVRLRSNYMIVWMCTSIGMDSGDSAWGVLKCWLHGWLNGCGLVRSCLPRWVGGDRGIIIASNLNLETLSFRFIDWSLWMEDEKITRTRRNRRDF